MATIKFLIQSTKNPSAIHLRLKDGNVDIKSRTGLFINPTNWSKTKQKPKTLKRPELKSLNFELEKIKIEILEAYNQLQLKKGKPSSQWIKDIIQGDSGDSKESLIGYLESYIEKNRNRQKLRAIQKLENLKAIIEEFQKYSHTSYLLADVDLTFQNLFVDYLSEVRLYRQTTIHRTVKFLKTICRDARVNGLKTSYQLDALGVKDGKVNIIYLSELEIEKVRQTKLSKPHLENAKNWLLLSCYLGQRGGDLLSFTAKDLIKHNGEFLLDISQEKTSEPIYVLLLPEALSVLKSIKGSFPKRISYQKYNQYIKEVCKEAGLTQTTFGTKMNPETKRVEDGYYEKWELVTTHIGRRSYATNYYGKIPTPLLMQQTGHKSEKMFLKYIGKGSIEKVHDLAAAHKKLHKDD